jgi:hypothetical protein
MEWMNARDREYVELIKKNKNGRFVDDELNL